MSIKHHQHLALCCVIFLYHSVSVAVLQKWWLSCFYVQAQPVALRSILRDDETFSTHLTENLSVPASVAQSLINAKIFVNPVSIISPLCSFPSKNPNRLLKQDFPTPINKRIKLLPQYSKGRIYFEQCAWIFHNKMSQPKNWTASGTDNQGTNVVSALQKKSHLKLPTLGNLELNELATPMRVTNV